VLGQPQVTFPHAKVNATYTFLVLDMDRPSPLAPFMSPYRMWLVVHIPGWDLLRGTVDNGLVISNWEPPNPAEFTGFHEYHQVLWEEPVGFDATAHLADTGFGRWRFDLRRFKDKHQLWGEPAAKSYFLTQRDIFDESSIPGVIVLSIFFLSTILIVGVIGRTRRRPRRRNKVRVPAVRNLQ
jgi:hypothetical protein